MSCGKHHETPCSEVLEQVYIYLDGEIDKGDYNKVRQHPRCAQLRLRDRVRRTPRQSARSHS